MGDENECVLSTSCTIQTEKDDSPEDDNMVQSAGQTLIEKLDNMEGLYFEVSGTLSNTDCALLTEEDSQLLEESLKSKAGKEKGETINWPAFGKSPISEYGDKRYYVCCFHGCMGGGYFRESCAVDIVIKEWAR
jgi:hypothetical protein